MKERKCFIITTILEWPEAYYIVHAGFKLTAILLPQLSKGWDYRHKLPCLA